MSKLPAQLYHNCVVFLSPDPVHGWDSIHHRTAEDLPVLLSGSQVERHSVLPGRHLDSPHRVAHHRHAG